MKLQGENITVTVDQNSGATTGIFQKDDPNDWILEDAEWGLINDFYTQSVSEEAGLNRFLYTHIRLCEYCRFLIYLVFRL